jgi:hypothetical protein
VRVWRLHGAPDAVSQGLPNLKLLNARPPENR